MKYIFLINMKIPEYDWYIKLAKEYELQVHPNITDEINVDELSCSITSIRFDVDNDFIWLDLNIDDPQYCYVKSSEEAIKILVSDMDELSEYGWRMIDYDLGEWREPIKRIENEQSN